MEYILDSLEKFKGVTVDLRDYAFSVSPQRFAPVF